MWLPLGGKAVHSVSNETHPGNTMFPFGNSEDRLTLHGTQPRSHDLALGRRGEADLFMVHLFGESVYRNLP